MTVKEELERAQVEAVTCKEFHKYVSAYVDHELRLELAVALEEHATGCNACSRRLEAEQWTAAIVRSCYVQHPLPPGLVERIRLRIGERQRGSRRPWGVVTAVAALVLVALVPAVQWSKKRFIAPPQVMAALQLYEDVLAQRISAEVNTADAAAADRWLAQKFPFYSPGLLRTSSEMELAGVAAVEVLGRQAGAVMYRAQNGPALLLITAKEDLPGNGRGVYVGNTEFRLFHRQGRKVLMWNHGAVSYILVSRGQHDGAQACASCHENVHSDRLNEFVPSVRVLGRGT